MSALNRSKPFRFSSVSELKNDKYSGLKDLPPPPQFSMGVAASAQWIAAAYGSSANVIVLPVQTAHYTRSASPYSLGLGSELGALAFSPHNDGALATADQSGCVKLWQVPDSGLAANSSAPAMKCEMGVDSLHSLRFHPSASSLAAAGGKGGLGLADLQAGRVIQRMATEGFSKDIVSLDWTRDGSLLAALSKNNTFSALDPRTAGEGALKNGGSQTASMKKTHQVLFTGGDSAQSSQLLLFGLSSGQRPLIQYFDPRRLDQAALERDLDFSNGFVMSAYDFDTNLLFVTVRGSNVIQLFDVEQERQKAAQVPVTAFSAPNTFKGFTLVNKRGVATNDTEVDRIIMLGSEAIEPLSVRVPRKVAGFHEDLYPQTADASPAMSADEYWSGQNALPRLVSMTDIHLAKGGARLTVQEKFDPLKSTVAAKAQRVTIDEEEDKQPTQQKQPTPAAAAGITQKAVYTSATRASLDSKLRTSIYRHTGCREPPSIHDTYYDMKIGQTLPLAENIRANTKFFAVPWSVSGGSGIGVFPLSRLGRCRVGQPVVKGHKSQATTFDLCCRPKHENLFASGSVDGDIRVYSIPDDGLSADLHDEQRLMNTDGKLTLVRFHPFIDHVLVSATSAFGEHNIDFWDLTDGSKRFAISEGHTDSITDLAFHGSGHLIATAARDGKVRVFNTATRKLVKEFAVPEGVRDTRVLWVGPSSLVTVGFGAGAIRSASYWNVDGDCAAPLFRLELERLNNIPIARYDEDSRLLFIANHGGTFVQTIQVKDEAPYLELLDTLQTKADCAGFVFLPKAAVDVNKVEIIKSLKLTKDCVQPLTHAVPRKRVEFFQDDLFPHTRDLSVDLMAREAFFEGRHPEGVEPIRVSLNTRGLTPLSDAPEEEMTDRQVRYQQSLIKKDAPKAVGALGYSSGEEVKKHFTEIAKNLTPGTNRWDAKQDNSRVDVDEDEWD